MTAGAAAGNLPMPAVLCLPLLFAAGMTVMDTTDGVLMAKAYNWALVNPLRKIFYNITTTGLSIAVALVIGAIEILQVLIAAASACRAPFFDLVGARRFRRGSATSSSACSSSRGERVGRAVEIRPRRGAALRGAFPAGAAAQARRWRASHPPQPLGVRGPRCRLGDAKPRRPRRQCRQDRRMQRHTGRALRTIARESVLARHAHALPPGRGVASWHASTRKSVWRMNASAPPNAAGSSTWTNTVAPQPSGGSARPKSGEPGGRASTSSASA